MYIFPDRPAPEQESQWIERSLRIGDCFDVLLHNKFEYCPQVFKTLKQYGITLEDDVYILVQFDSGVLWTADQILLDRSVSLIDRIFAIWGHVFRMHLFTSDGFLYGLLCFSEPFQGERFTWQVQACCDRLMSWREHQELRILVSRDEAGEQGIFHAANSLRYGVDYLRFFDEGSGVVFVDLHKQTALSGGAELAAYQRLSRSLAERFREKDFGSRAAAEEILALMRHSCACSIESLHNQMQSFNLLFLNHLITHGLVDEAFLRQKMIRSSIMQGDNASRYLDNLTMVLTQLHDRYLELQERYDVDHLNRVRAYVERHIASMELSVSSVAEHFHVNRSQLTKQFRDYYGQSLAEFIHSSRLDLACLLLESHPGRNMEQIAREAGYYSLSTMYRAFQKSGLCTPAQYRQNMTTADSLCLP